MGSGWLLGEGESIFIKDVAPGRSTMSQWMGPCPGVHDQHKLDLIAYLKKRIQSWEWGLRGRD